ncbi:MAG: hypothetical protein MJE68_07040 [Proteobacteria bacterium]|nr:hypothetical protein [Pseudomonadota bacterium]
MERIIAYLKIAVFLKWLASEAPDLIEQTAIAPDISGSGVFLVVDGFWSCPLHWYHTTVRNIIILICQVSRHAKISNLEEIEYCMSLYELQPCMFKAAAAYLANVVL